MSERKAYQSEESVGALTPGDSDSCEQFSVGAGTPTLQEQCVLTAEPCTQPHQSLFI